MLDLELSPDEKERRNQVDLSRSDRQLGARTVPITDGQTSQLSEQESRSAHSPGTAGTKQMRVDTQTTIFDQVPPISAQVNINLQQEGSRFEVVHVASNASQTSVPGPSAAED